MYQLLFPSRSSVLAVSLFLITTFCAAGQAQTPAKAPSATPVGTKKVWARIDGVAIEGLVQGPSGTEAPLQVACVFEYTDGDIFNSPPALPANLNGMVHLDQALNGIITELRKSGRFQGHALETILLTPPAGKIKARRLLLIGLGPRDKFTPDLMTQVGTVALREALNLGVTHFSFASDLKDAGVDSPTALVAGNVTRGIITAYRAQAFLRSRHMAVYKPLVKVTLLAGPAFFTTAGEGIRQAVSSYLH